VVAYEELGAEALRRLEVEDFPVTVINDIYGGDLYEEGKAKYHVKAS
jgi:fumarate hydratase subunit beta